MIASIATAWCNKEYMHNRTLRRFTFVTTHRITQVARSGTVNLRRNFNNSLLSLVSATSTQLPPFSTTPCNIPAVRTLDLLASLMPGVPHYKPLARVRVNELRAAHHGCLSPSSGLITFTIRSAHFFCVQNRKFPLAGISVISAALPLFKAGRHSNTTVTAPRLTPLRFKRIHRINAQPARKLTPPTRCNKRPQTYADGTAPGNKGCR